MQAIFRNEILPREAAVAAARSFVDAEREHMKMEEEVFFPIAVGVLTDEDWRTVEGDLKSMQDPLLGNIVEEEFKDLRNLLLSWGRT